MSSIATRTAFRTAFRAAPRLRVAAVSRRFRSDAVSTEELNNEKLRLDERETAKRALKEGAGRDPELIVLLCVMSGVFALAGWHFSRSPTSASSERAVSKIPDSEPWNSGTAGKYQYFPGGDPNAPVKDAPTALNTVVIPNVTLPKELHDQYNKWGKDGYP